MPPYFLWALRVSVGLGAATLLAACLLTIPDVVDSASGSGADDAGVVGCSNAAPTSKLVAHWSFDEGSGTTIKDSSGLGQDGEFMGGSPDRDNSDCPLHETALHLSPADGGDYVLISKADKLQITGSITLSARIHLNSLPGPSDPMVIVSKHGYTSSRGWSLSVSDGNAFMGIAADNCTHLWTSHDTVLKIGTWYRVAGVYDATAKTLKVYVDGKSSGGLGNKDCDGGVHTGGSVPGQQYNSTNNKVNIGRLPVSNVVNFDGLIDDVRIYDRALSLKEVQALP